MRNARTDLDIWPKASVCAAAFVMSSAATAQSAPPAAAIAAEEPAIEEITVTGTRCQGRVRAQAAQIGAGTACQILIG